MNRQLLNYMAADSWQGLKRNPGSTIASILLIVLALLLIGALLSVRLFTDDATEYIESQLSMKVYIEKGLEAEDIAAVLSDKAFVEQVAVESGDKALDKLAFFFNGKEHLLEAFESDVMLDAVKLQVSDKGDMDRIAKELESISGIEQVVYPQKLAVTLDLWITRLDRYGTAGTIVFFAIAFGMVYQTFHLAVYRRQQELAVKLFVGMNPKAVQAQFLLEGALLSIFGAGIAMALTAVFQLAVLKPFQQALPFAGQLETKDLFTILALQLLSALVIGVAASFLSTRKRIAHG